MKGVRVWILVLAVTTFVCGVASGTILSERGRLGDEPDFMLGEYERRFVAQFELSPERERALHVFLEEYAREVERISRTPGITPTVSSMGRVTKRSTETGAASG